MYAMFALFASIRSQKSFLVILIKRVYTLWDHRHFVLHALIAGFVLSYMGVLSFGVLSVLQILSKLLFI